MIKATNTIKNMKAMIISRISNGNNIKVSKIPADIISTIPNTVAMKTANSDNKNNLGEFVLKCLIIFN